MKYSIVFIFFLFMYSLVHAQGTWPVPNIQNYKVPTLQEAINTPAKIGTHISVAEAGRGGDFVVISANAAIADGVRIISKGDGTCLLRETSQTMSIKAEWFGMVADGVTDSYAGAQALAAFVNARHGYVNLDYGSLWYNRPVYKLNVIKIQKQVSNDTTTNNGIVDINFSKDTNLHIYGSGAKIVIKGDFVRKITAISGNFAYSAYGTVCPFFITDCNHLTIQDLELYGEVDKMTRENVVEGQCYGIKIFSSSYVNLQNLYVHHFATDGLYAEVSGTSHNGVRWNCEHIEVDNSKFWYNARQGFTAGSVNDFTALNSSFSHNGDSLGGYLHHAPSAGVDLEPIVGPPTTNEYTRNIHFINCDFDNNLGAAVEASLSVVKDVFLDGCHVDNRKFNNQYVFIFGIENSNVTNSTIYTGTGNIYPYWNSGETKQSGRYDNNTIICGASGFLIVGSTPQYGLTINNNRLIGLHAATFNSYFPYISSVARITNNKFFLDSNLYYGTRLSIMQYLAQASNNEFFTNLDTTGGRRLNVSFANAKMVTGEVFPANGAIKCYEAPNWPLGVPYTNGATSGGNQINMNSGGKQVSFSFGTAPVNGQYYEAGSIIYMINPDAATYSYLQCSVSGIAGTTAVFEQQGKLGGSGRTLTYKGDPYGTVSQAEYQDSAIYTTRFNNDTGAVLFKIPLGFTNPSLETISGTITIRGRGQATWTVTLTPAGTTFFQPTLNIHGDSSMLSTKVRLLRDANSNAFIGFFDTTTVLPVVTIVDVRSVMLSSSPNALLQNANKAWTATLVKSFVGYTITNNLTNTTGSLWPNIWGKPTNLVTSLTTNSGSGPTLVNGVLNIPPSSASSVRFADSAIQNNPTAIQDAKFNIYKAGGGNHIANYPGLTQGAAVPATSALDVTMYNANFYNVAYSASVSGATSGINIGSTSSFMGYMSVGGYAVTPNSYYPQETAVTSFEEFAGRFYLKGKMGTTIGSQATLNSWGILDSVGFSLNTINPTARLNIKQNTAAYPSLQFDLAGAVSKTTPVRGAVEVLPYTILFTDSTGLKDTLATRKWMRANFSSTGGTSGNNYRLPYDGVSTHYLGGDTIYHDFPSTARAAISLNLTTTGASGAATGSYNATTGVISINVPQYTGGGGGGTETDPIYSVNGVTLNTVQALTAPKTFPASTAGSPSLVLANSGTNYAGSTPGALWTYNQHVYAMLNGVATQIDHQAFDTSQCCTFIVNGTGSQIGANMNISGSAGVGTLFFNQAPATGSANDNVLTVSSSGTVGQVSVASITDAVNTVTVTSSSYTVPNVAGSKTVVLVNYSAGTATVVLPSAAANADKEVVIKDITTQSVTMSGGWVSDANTIASFSYGADTWHSNGTTWYMIAKM